MKECPFGLECYRKRPEHFKEFAHPPGHEIAAKFNTVRNPNEPRNKKPKIDQKIVLARIESHKKEKSKEKLTRPNIPQTSLGSFFVQINTP